MKSTYEAPEMDVLFLYAADVIADSIVGLTGIDGAGEDEEEWNSVEWGSLN